MLLGIPKKITLMAALLSSAMWMTAVAQTSSASLQSQLETVYKVTQLEGNTQTVISPGALLKLAKSNLLYETSMENMFRCNATVRQDKSVIPGGACLSMTKGAGTFLQAGQLLYITKIKINPGKDIVTFELVEAAAAANGNAAWPTFKTGINFVFEAGYLAKADPGQIADLINTVLPLDGAGNDNSQGASQPAQMQMGGAPSQPAASQMQTQSQASGAPGSQVQLGMTEDQVKGILGQPTVSKNYAGSTVYMYQKTITFQNGKVSAIR